MIRVRELSAEEQQMIERLAHSRTAEARLVERARIIWQAYQLDFIHLTPQMRAYPSGAQRALMGFLPYRVWQVTDKKSRRARAGGGPRQAYPRMSAGAWYTRPQSGRAEPDPGAQHARAA